MTVELCWQYSSHLVWSGVTSYKQQMDMTKTHAVTVLWRHVADCQVAMTTAAVHHSVDQCPSAAPVCRSTCPAEQWVQQVIHHQRSAPASAISDSTVTTRASPLCDDVVVVHSLTNTSEHLVLCSAYSAAVKIQKNYSQTVETSKTGFHFLFYQYCSDIKDCRKEQQCLHQTDSPSAKHTGNDRNNLACTEIVKQNSQSSWRYLTLHCPTTLSNKLQ